MLIFLFDSVMFHYFVKKGISSKNIFIDFLEITRKSRGFIYNYVRTCIETRTTRSSNDLGHVNTSIVCCSTFYGINEDPDDLIKFLLGFIAAGRLKFKSWINCQLYAEPIIIPVKHRLGILTSV